MRRATRAQIVRLTNDIRAIDDQLHRVIEQIHGTTPDTSSFSVPVPNGNASITDSQGADALEPNADGYSYPPFATVGHVTEGSPAWECGLREGDRIVSFGSVNGGNGGTVRLIAGVLRHSAGAPVDIVVQRADDLRVRLTLSSERLGCEITQL